MTDITMCMNEKCTRKEECYRFKAKPDELWQSYAIFNPVCNKDGKCEYFLKLIDERM